MSRPLTSASTMSPRWTLSSMPLRIWRTRIGVSATGRGPSRGAGRSEAIARSAVGGHRPRIPRGGGDRAAGSTDRAADGPARPWVVRPEDPPRGRLLGSVRHELGARRTIAACRGDGGRRCSRRRLPAASAGDLGLDGRARGFGELGGHLAATAAAPGARPAIVAFTERLSTGTLTYRVAFKGTARSSTHTLPVSGTMDVSGADFASSFTSTGAARRRAWQDAGQVRAVGTKGWIKRGSTAWQAIEGYKVANSYVPFKAVADASDVRYLGSVQVGDATFHKVGISGALLMHPNTLPYLFQKEKVDETTLELLNDNSGRPRSGTWTMRAQARVGVSGGQLQRLVYNLDLTFARVGAKITIGRP